MKYDIVIIGGGIIGLATALQISNEKSDISIAVLEKEPDVARHQTGNNSGVIHSGIYYKPGSSKARNCIEGRKRLIEFCDKYEINYEICGKVIVATEEKELSQLDKLFDQGVANGLTGLRKLSAEGIREYEPYVKGIAGILVPQTGIINYGEVAKMYAELFKKNNGKIFLGERVINIKQYKEYSEIRTDRGMYEAKMIINCAGLYSDKIALMVRQELDIRIIPFRGEYYKLRESSRHLVRNLVYPVPNPAFPFLGVHFTRHSNQEIEAGPNAVFALKREGYRRFNFNIKEFIESVFWSGFRIIAIKYWRTGFGEFYRSFSKIAFAKALKKMIPGISVDDLIPGGVGIRAQACTRDGTLVDDFLILKSPLQIDVLNVPSPAATSSLSIAQEIFRMVFE